MARQRKITFELDAENQKLKQKLDEVNQRLDNTKRKSSGLGATFKKVFGALGLTGLITSAVIAFKEMFGVFVDFDKGMRNVNSILGLSEDQFASFSDEVLGVQKELGISSKELTDALYQTVSAGVAAGDAIQFLRDAAKVGVAGVATTTEAVDILTTVLNAFHLEASETTRVSDVLFQTIKLGKTNLAELAASMAQVAPIAAANKVDFEEVSAAIATLTKQGVPTTQAVTQIRSSIISLGKVLGDGWAEVMSYQEAVAEVAKQAGGSNNKLKEMLGRIEAVNAVLGLTGANALEAASDLEAMNGALGASGQAFEEQSKSIQRRWDVFAADFIATTTRITDSLLDWLLPLEKSESLVDKTTATMGGLRSEFDRLNSVYTILRRQTSLTEGETELYRKTIVELNKGYGNYLKNINLETAALEDVEIALADAGLELDKYVQKQIRSAIVQDRADEIVALGKRQLNIEIARVQQIADLRERARKDDRFSNLNYYQEAEVALVDFYAGQEKIIKEETEQLKKEIAISNQILAGLLSEPPSGGGGDGDGPLSDAIEETKEYIEGLRLAREELGKTLEELDQSAEDADFEKAFQESIKKSIEAYEDLEVARKQSAEDFEEHVEQMTGLAENLGTAMASGVLKGGLKEALKNVLITLISFLEQKIIAATISSILDPLLGLSVGVGAARIAGAALVLEGLKGAIASFALGVEDFGGGLAKVHKGETLVNLSKGTNVHTKAETEKLFNMAKVEALLQELIKETRVLQNPEPVLKADTVFKMYNKEASKRLSNN